jgi:CRISPR/Cas system CSM-associated protein Csm5 (group 7 of RAMP superfamily)
MSTTETIVAFAAAFVKAEFRKRFVHEALKKPSKLHKRVCHRIEELFHPQYKGRSLKILPDSACLVLGWGCGLQESTWREAQNQMQRGGGLLVIDQSAKKFYAETEGSPKSEVWAGEC